MMFNVVKRKLDAEVAHNNAGGDSSSDVNASPHAQHHLLQFPERNSLTGKQISHQHRLVRLKLSCKVLAEISDRNM